MCTAMGRAPRADKTKRAGLHRFNTWYEEEEGKMHKRCIQCRLQDSPLYADMKRTPHMLLYFLLNVLQRLVQEFWGSMESSETSAKMCVATMSKCSVHHLTFSLPSGPKRTSHGILRILAFQYVSYHICDLKRFVKSEMPRPK